MQKPSFDPSPILPITYYLLMSRRNPSFGELLLLAPWWVSAVLGALAYIGLRWVLPAIGSDNVIFKGFIQAGHNLAWFAALIFAVTSLLSALMAWKKRALLDAQSGGDSLRSLDWKEFEWLVGEAYRRQGYSVEEFSGGGADGGIDLVLRKGGGTWLVQCKQWRVQAVGAPVVREIWGLVAHHRANGAIVITSGRFTREAHSFASEKTLELVDGPALLALVKAVQREKGQQTVPPATQSPKAPYPTLPQASFACPQCNAPMVRRIARKGANAGNEFWGCSTYPTCRGVRAA